MLWCTSWVLWQRWGVERSAEKALQSKGGAHRIQQKAGVWVSVSPRPWAAPQEERAALEAKVTQQLEEERAALLARKRAEQAARRRAQDNLERILAENQRKVRRMRAAVFQGAKIKGHDRAAEFQGMRTNWGSAGHARWPLKVAAWWGA